MAADPTFEEVLGCQKVLFEWADSFDTKARVHNAQHTMQLRKLTQPQDWERLSKCIAPTMKVDYSSFMPDAAWDALPAAEFVAMASSPHFLGNPRLKTQHFVGGTRWEKVGADEIVAHQQMRVAHQRYTDDSLTEVAVKGHAHGAGTMWYRRVDGVWRFAGLRPDIRWSEFNYDQVFKEHEEKGAEASPQPSP